MSQLIVTADDLGLHRGMNEGAVRAHREGIVTAVSISACGREVEHAAALVRECPELDAGIHLTLVEERPVLPPGEVRSLVSDTGTFPGSWRALVARWISGGIDYDEVENEFRAQAERLGSLGIRLVHANGHQHLHLLPGIIERVVRVASQCGIGYVRIANESIPGFAAGPRSWGIRAMNRLGRSARRKLPPGIATCDRTIGIADAGHLDRARIDMLLAGAVGVTELVVHPGSGTESIARDYDWGYDWDAETEALCDPGIVRALVERGIALARPSTVRC